MWDVIVLIPNHCLSIYFGDEVEIAIMARTQEKADGVENLPVELVQAGRESP